MACRPRGSPSPGAADMQAPDRMLAAVVEVRAGEGPPGRRGAQAGRAPRSRPAAPRARCRAPARRWPTARWSPARLARWPSPRCPSPRWARSSCSPSAAGPAHRSCQRSDAAPRQSGVTLERAPCWQGPARAAAPRPRGRRSDASGAQPAWRGPTLRTIATCRGTTLCRRSTGAHSAGPCADAWPGSRHMRRASQARRGGGARSAG